jgi:hypothetical protein
MKKVIFLLALIAGFSFNLHAQQDKSQRASPPDSVTVTTDAGTTITINYSKPSLKGRELTDLIPLGKVWRTGANEATTFEINKDVKINGKDLKAGKYGLYTIPGGEGVSTVIFNKVWNQWGLSYSQDEDALRIQATTRMGNPFMEQFKITVDKTGLVRILWGEASIDFEVK